MKTKEKRNNIQEKNEMGQSTEGCRYTTKCGETG